MIEMWLKLNVVEELPRKLWVIGENGRRHICTRQIFILHKNQQKWWGIRKKISFLPSSVTKNRLAWTRTETCRGTTI